MSEEKTKREKAIELCIKLKALAERGEGGERANAESQLRKKMDEYGITDEEIGMAIKRYASFRYATKNEQYLLEKIIPYVVADAILLQDDKVKDTYFVECSEEEALQVRKLLGFYLDCYEKEQEYFFRAFILQNNLLPKYSGAKGDSGFGSEEKKSAGEQRISFELPEEPEPQFSDKELRKIESLSRYIERYYFTEKYLDSSMEVSD